MLTTREFPTNYPSDAVRILEAMSFGKGLMILGSMAIRSQLYAGDYDGYEIVKCDAKTKEACLTSFRKKFQEIVAKIPTIPNAYVGDIKSGVVPEWNVLPNDAKLYNKRTILAKIAALRDAKIISAKEAEEADKAVADAKGPAAFLQLQNALKFHIVRWTPSEVAANKKILRDGNTMTLEQAFCSPGLTKLDVIALVAGNRFTDFSVIYEFKFKGRTLNPVPMNVSKSLRENIRVYIDEGNYFKAIKRQFALAKYNNNLKEIARLTPILNGDLGRLYHIVGDIDTLVRLLEEEKPNMTLVRTQIDQFTERLSHIYTLKPYLGKEAHILQIIRAMLKQPPEKVLASLKSLGDLLNDMLQKAAKPLLRFR